MLFYDGFGKCIGEAREYLEKVHFFHADNQLLGTAELDVDCNDRGSLVCRMSAAWAFQMTAYTTTQMAFRTVWYAVLIYFGFWFLKSLNNYSYSTQE